MGFAYLYFAFTITLILQCVAGEYKASVVEYNFVYNKNLNSSENVMKNVEAYVTIIKNQKFKTHIIVFPETGFMGKFFKEVEIEVPAPDWTSVTFKDKILTMLSDAAKDANIYVVVNLREKDKDKHYNTNVVFRSNGTIAAKYRKYNLFNEKFVNKPDKPELVTFKTDFGEEFGIFTCFDILFKSPALDLVNKGVKNFIFPTHWFSELPYLTAIQYQWSWSWANNVNLLAAGMNGVQNGSSGSGIYNMRQPLTNSDYCQLTQDETKILTKTVKSSRDFSPQKFTQSGEFIQTSQTVKKDVHDQVKPHLVLQQQDLKQFTAKPFQPGENCIKTAVADSKKNEFILKCNISEFLCNKDLCCSFDVSAEFRFCSKDTCKNFTKVYVNNTIEDSFFQFGHQYSVFSGVRDFGGAANGGIQICSIISCLSDSVDSCGKVPANEVIQPEVYKFTSGNFYMVNLTFSSIVIQGNLTTNDSFITPNVLLMDSQVERFGSLNGLDKVSVIVGNNLHTLQMYRENSVVGTVGLFSRVFRWDGEAPTTGGAVSPTSFTSQVAFAVVAMIVIKMIFIE